MLQRDRLQAAVQVIGPTVIAALRFVGIALFRSDHHRAAMRALVVDRIYLPVGSPNHNDRLLGELRAEIVAFMFDLAFVADIYPSVSEDAFKLKIEDKGSEYNRRCTRAGCTRQDRSSLMRQCSERKPVC